jgi:hypothetical protein
VDGKLYAVSIVNELGGGINLPFLTGDQEEIKLVLL